MKRLTKIFLLGAFFGCLISKKIDKVIKEPRGKRYGGKDRPLIPRERRGDCFFVGKLILYQGDFHHVMKIEGFMGTEEFESTFLLLNIRTREEVRLPKSTVFDRSQCTIYGEIDETVQNIIHYKGEDFYGIAYETSKDYLKNKYGLIRRDGSILEISQIEFEHCGKIPEEYQQLINK